MRQINVDLFTRAHSACCRARVRFALPRAETFWRSGLITNSGILTRRRTRRNPVFSIRKSTYRLSPFTVKRLTKINANMAVSVNACITTLGRHDEHRTAETHNSVAHVARGLPAIRSRRRWPALSGVLAQVPVRKRRALVGADARGAAILNAVGLAARSDPARQSWRRLTVITAQPPE
jgi:hypothetical protein